MTTNTELIKLCLIRVHKLIESLTFYRDSDEKEPWKATFAELIMTVDDLLKHFRQLGQEIAFTEAVGVNGKIQDITSLVVWMRSCLPALITDLSDHLPANRLNRYFNQGNGYFANGCFFSVDYDNEQAFFIDDQRIYLKHHLVRLVDEVESYLSFPNSQQTNRPNLA
ncbi:hypothetical protein [Larkinella terrae]|uniref:Uncharacterized protein n=1 Tax=Larkinella terrae TaxID=2025311 RepID=A0A7K0EIT3_9BACT|nr:hypothetical protein [Larkinella terrae]MRS61665.1 hypothetical protein [Larkinella terrae]